ncbi:MAG TPA: ketopantoate reductase family protein [Candidatus Bathyarchaeia archaeon]|nr:ketopantoate reductase family protein [Candidatus Bathyarchaeia archaeon]
MTPGNPRIVVAGAGAVGSVIGGLLAGAGSQVTLVGREPHMSAIARDGLDVSGVFGTVHVHVRTATDLGLLDEPFDLALVTVKSHATEEVAATLARWRSRPRGVVSLQNGLGNVEALGRALGAERVLGARVIFGAVLAAPGRAVVTVNAQPVAIGPPGRPASPDLARAAERLAALLAGAGIPAEPVADIEPVLWEKVLYNCGLNPLGALHGLSYGEVASTPGLRAELDRAIEEGFRVAQAAGVNLSWPDAQGYLRHFHARLLPPTAAHHSSMRQDLEAGRKTEIDAINGAIVRAGARLGIATPVHAELVRAVRAAEARRQDPGRG